MIKLQVIIFPVEKELGKYGKYNMIYKKLQKTAIKRLEAPDLLA